MKFQEDKVFAVIGDSFTFGQGLYYYEWFKNYSGPSLKPSVNGELHHWAWPSHEHILTNKDYEEIKKYRYVDKLSKHLQMEYIVRRQNGGNQQDLFYTINQILNSKIIGDGVVNRKVDLIVLNLTFPYRDVDIVFDGETEYKYLSQLSSDIKIIGNKCKSRGIKFLVWSWNEELATILQDEKFFVKLVHKNKSYICFNQLEYDFKYHKTPITFQQEELFGVADDHPSKYGHQIIYESIVNHLKKYDV